MFAIIAQKNEKPTNACYVVGKLQTTRSHKESIKAFYCLYLRLKIVSVIYNEQNSLDN